MTKVRGKQLLVDQDINYNDNKIISLANPENPQDAATKAYVDNLASGVSWKDAVRVATTEEGMLLMSYQNGSTVDGVNLITGDRILIKNQSAQLDNGIYIVAESGAPERASDAADAEGLAAAAVFVEEGTVNGDTAWVQTSDDGMGFVFAKFFNIDTDSVPTKLDKELVPSDTTGNESSTGISIGATPSANSSVAVYVNGVKVRLGDGVKHKDCYFSDGPFSQARAIEDIAENDILYWNGTIAGYDLDDQDSIDLEYNV